MPHRMKQQLSSMPHQEVVGTCASTTSGLWFSPAGCWLELLEVVCHVVSHLHDACHVTCSQKMANGTKNPKEASCVVLKWIS
jgi:hypothetical protein